MFCNLFFVVKILKRVGLGLWVGFWFYLVYINISDIKKILERKGKRKVFDVFNLDMKFISFF